mmetsp:Transcript_22404/g.60547  ORF Transcript_22404/g.60547 Transcript_22404/m.60547 type:complete len:210 (-) Transcript_22404:415-1044(-)
MAAWLGLSAVCQIKSRCTRCPSHMSKVVTRWFSSSCSLRMSWCTGSWSESLSISKLKTATMQNFSASSASRIVWTWDLMLSIAFCIRLFTAVVLAWTSRAWTSSASAFFLSSAFSFQDTTSKCSWRYWSHTACSFFLFSISCPSPDTIGGLFRFFCSHSPLRSFRAACSFATTYLATSGFAFILDMISSHLLISSVRFWSNCATLLGGG